MKLSPGVISNLVEIAFDTGMNSTSLISFFNSFGLNHEIVPMLSSKRQFANKAWNELNGNPKISNAVIEILHPHYWSDDPEARERHIETLNRSLSYDQIELVEVNGTLKLSSPTLVSGTSMLKILRSHGEELGHDNMVSRIATIEAEIEARPENAIGAAKELIEATTREIIRQFGEEVGSKPNPSSLVKQALKCLSIAPDDISDKARGLDAIRSTLTALANIAHQLDELRSLYGSGHGKDASKKNTLEARHARLAVGAAGTLCLFLVETLKQKNT